MRHYAGQKSKRQLAKRNQPTSSACFARRRKRINTHNDAFTIPPTMAPIHSTHSKMERRESLHPDLSHQHPLQKMIGMQRIGPRNDSRTPANELSPAVGNLTFYSILSS